MLTLYDYLPSQNGWKVRTLLTLLGLPFRLEEVAIFDGESRTPEFLAKNPAGAIPVLELEDSRTIAESNAILWYLAEETPYLPADRFARAKVMQWLSFEQYYVEPTIGTLRFWMLTGRMEANAGKLVETKRENGLRALRALESSLGEDGFLVGDFSIADLSIYAYGHRASDAGYDMRAFPKTQAWLDRIAREIGPGHTVHPYGGEARLRL